MVKNLKALAILVGVFILLVWYIISLRGDIKEKKEALQVLENNNEQLLTGTRILKAENGNLVYKVNEVTVTSEELKSTNKDLEAELKNAKVKIKNLESFISISLSSKDTVTVINRDTIIQNLPFRTFDYNTKWYHVRGVQDTNTTKLEISCYHDINISNEVIYKGWWIFKRPIKNEVTVTVGNSKDTMQKIQSFYISKKRQRRASN